MPQKGIHTANKTITEGHIFPVTFSNPIPVPFQGGRIVRDNSILWLGSGSSQFHEEEA